MATKIFDASKNFVGTVGADGIIRDRFNMKKAYVLEDGTVQDTLRIKIGQVDEKGTQRNRFDQRVGFIDPEGRIRSLAGLKIGTISNVQDTSLRYAGAAAFVLVVTAVHKRQTQILGRAVLGV